MKVQHVSDAHGNREFLEIPDDVDVVIWSGDNLPEPPYLSPWVDWATAARQYQREFMASLDMPSRLKGRPFVSVPGNHDWLTFGDWEIFGAETQCVAWPPYVPTVKRVKTNGATLLIAGAVGIPYINGKYNYESNDADIYQRAKATLDLLLSEAGSCWNKGEGVNMIFVTHTPPWKVLDMFNGQHYGSFGIERAIEDAIEDSGRFQGSLTHLFGHMHDSASPEPVILPHGRYTGWTVLSRNSATMSTTFVLS